LASSLASSQIFCIIDEAFKTIGVAVNPGSILIFGKYYHKKKNKTSNKKQGVKNLPTINTETPHFLISRLRESEKASKAN
jgi:hypothetical protein